MLYVQQERDLYGGNTRISPENSFEYLKIAPPEPIKFLPLLSSWEMEGRRRSAKLWSNSLSPSLPPSPPLSPLFPHISSRYYIPPTPPGFPNCAENNNKEEEEFPPFFLSLFSLLSVASAAEGENGGGTKRRQIRQFT